MIKKLAIVLAIVVAVILVIAGVGYYLVTRPSDVEQQAASVGVSDEAAQSAQEKIDDFTTQLSTAPEGEVLSLTLTDEEVTSGIVRELKFGDQALPLDVQNPRIMFVQDKIMASGDITVSGFQTNIAIEAEAQAENNQLKLKINQLSLGKLPLPDALVNKIKEGLIPGDEIIIDMSEMDIPINLENISIVDGSIVLTGTAR